jgi:hypothetical protein
MSPGRWEHACIPICEACQKKLCIETFYRSVTECMSTQSILPEVYLPAEDNLWCWTSEKSSSGIWELAQPQHAGARCDATCHSSLPTEGHCTRLLTPTGPVCCPCKCRVATPLDACSSDRAVQGCAIYPVTHMVWLVLTLFPGWTSAPACSWDTNGPPSRGCQVSESAAPSLGQGAKGAQPGRRKSMVSAANSSHGTRFTVPLIAALHLRYSTNNKLDTLPQNEWAETLRNWPTCTCETRQSSKPGCKRDTWTLSTSMCL